MQTCVLCDERGGVLLLSVPQCGLWLCASVRNSQNTVLWLASGLSWVNIGRGVKSALKVKVKREALKHEHSL